MPEVKESFIALLSTPIYTVIILAEIIITSLHEHRIYSVRGTLENIYLSLCNIGVDVISRGMAIAVLSFFYAHRLISFDMNVWYWCLLVIGVDFMFYWLHRLDHRVRLFWAVHVTHHSATEFNFTVGFRSSVFQPLYRFIYFIPLAVAGFQSQDIYLVYSASQIYGIILHTQWTGRLKWLEWGLVTPSLHRVHHGSNPEYIDKNMGMVLIIWDRLFGTFQPEIGPVRYGITKNVDDRNPVNLVFHEWKGMADGLRQTSGFKEHVRYIFGPPEWDIDDVKRKPKS